MVDARRWFRVEYRDGAGVRPLGRLPDVPPHPATLAPFVSRLLLDGQQGGVLVLVEEATGADVARHPLDRGPRLVSHFGRKT